MRRCSKLFLHHVAAVGVIISSNRADAFAIPPSIMVSTGTRRSYRSDYLRASILEERELTKIAEPDILTAKPRSQLDRSDIVNGKKSLNAVDAKSLDKSLTKNSDIEKIRATRSKERMIKAQKLLEMAQVSPSQRLEMEEERRGANSTSFSTRRSRSPLPPRTSAAAHFNNTQDVYQMRMGSTFDSVDNPVDSKSLLPGGRWAEERDKSVGTSASEMEMRNKISAGQVAEVCVY